MWPRSLASSALILGLLALSAAGCGPGTAGDTTGGAAGTTTTGEGGAGGSPVTTSTSDGGTGGNPTGGAGGGAGGNPTGGAGGGAGGSPTGGAGGGTATGGSGGSAMTTGGGGGGPECTTGLDCPPSGSDCTVVDCVEGACVSGPAAQGTPVQGQAPGDCQEVQCDGNEGFQSVADPLDLPDDGDPCTDDLCDSGAPSHPSKAPGTPCGDDLTCTAAGACAGCSTPSQCPGSDDECQSRTCSAGECGLTFTASGTAVSTQTAFDCKTNVCDGNGATISQEDPADIPDDGNPCTDDLCVAGSPAHTPAPAGAPCDQGGSCDGAGACEYAPAVTATAPSDGATQVPVSTSIGVTFSEAMDPATLVAQTSAGPCTGTVRFSSDGFATCLGMSAAAPVMSMGDTVATWAPVPALSFGGTYKVSVQAGATGANGLSMAMPYSSPSGFTTALDSPCGPSVVISQIYDNAGGVAAIYNADFVELHNRGPLPASIGGWSVQYSSADNQLWTAAAFPAGTTIQPGAYFLIRMGPIGFNGSPLPFPDFVASPTINISLSGEMALLATPTASPPGVCPSGPVMDLVGYGNPLCKEGATAAPGAGILDSISRVGTCVDSGNNGSDWVVTPVAPHNASQSPPKVCACSLNGSGQPGEVDYCNLQFPTSLTVQAGQTTSVVFARAYELGVTETPGAPASLFAQIGFGPTTANPQSEPGWIWQNAIYNTQVGNDDEYAATLVPPSPGTYAYTSRFSFDGVQWTYCDLDGAGSNAGLSFQTAQLPLMTVTP